MEEFLRDIHCRSDAPNAQVKPVAGPRGVVSVRVFISAQ